MRQSLKCSTRSEDGAIAEEVSGYYADPLGFTLFAYPWGQGELAGQAGPDEWQAEFLRAVGDKVGQRGFTGGDPVEAIREAASSGHGVGKSALVSWLVDWIMSTRPMCKGVVTANTATQLKTKTWAEIAKWTAMCITAHWFEWSAAGMWMRHRSAPDMWRVDGVTCREENSEAFAGLHSASSTPFYIFDEASAIPERIHQVAEGGLTDGEPHWYQFGNPTRRNGSFYQNLFGRFKHLWGCHYVDSRKAKMTNKALLAQWERDHGEASDFFRVRARGVPPRASDLQFIPSDDVAAARKRPLPDTKHDPLIMGVDIARGGSDNNAIVFRRGFDARSIPSVKIPGEQTRDTTRMIAVCAELIAKHKPDAVMVDSTGVGGPVADRLRQLGHAAMDVGFGDASPNPQCANVRSYIWQRTKEWLHLGGCIDDDIQLEEDLCGPEFGHNKRDQLLLESKEHMRDTRGLASPDKGDALACTFAFPVSPRPGAYPEMRAPPVTHEYNPFE